MGYYNNKVEILRNWERKFDKTKSPIFAEKIESATGKSPDYINGKDTGIEPSHKSPYLKCEEDELVGIENKIIF